MRPLTVATALLLSGGIPAAVSAQSAQVATATPSSQSSAAMYAFLEKLGYRLPDGALRIRLVHVPESNRREEHMVVYAEAPEPENPAPLSEAEVQRHATEGLRVVPTKR